MDTTALVKRARELACSAVHANWRALQRSATASRRRTRGIQPKPVVDPLAKKQKTTAESDVFTEGSVSEEVATGAQYFAVA